MKLSTKLLLAVLSALLLVLSFVDKFSFIVWMCLIPYFIALANSSLRQSVGLSWITGMIFFGGITFWFTEYSYAFWFPIIGLLSIYFVFYGIVFFFVYSKIKWPYLRIAIISCTWIAGELLRHRTFLAFPWGVLGYSQHGYLAVMQISKFTGILGVSLLILLFNLSVAEVFIYYLLTKRIASGLSGEDKSIPNLFHKSNRQKRNSFVALICITSILAINIAYGLITLEVTGRNNISLPEGKKLNVALVQTNITFDDKYKKDTGVLIPEKYSPDRYFKEDTELVVFPESVIWGPITRDANKSFYEWVKHTAEKEDLYFIMGQILWDDYDNYYNVVQLYDDELNILGRYNKIHPLPCAEYMPYPGVLGFLSFMNIAKLNITPSREATLIEYPLKGNIGTNICFESTIALISRTFRENGADMLFTFTDDAGFKDSIASWHHLVFSRARAIENNSYMVHIGNNGISAIIDNSGRIIAKTSIVTKEVLYGSAYFNDKKSFYSIFGELLLYIYFGITFIIFIVFLARKRS